MSVFWLALAAFSVLLGEAESVLLLFALFAAPDAAVPDKAPPLKLIAKAKIDGKEIVREVTGAVPKVIEPGDIVTTTEQTEVMVKPGSEVRVTVISADGRVLAQGAMAALRATEEVVEAYLVG